MNQDAASSVIEQKWKATEVYPTATKSPAGRNLATGRNPHAFAP